MHATSPKSFFLAPDLADYVARAATRPDAVELELLATTSAMAGERAVMQIVPEQGRLLTMLAQMISARRAVEVGTFTGYSALCLARGLAPGGRLVTCDTTAEWLPIAERAWSAASVRDRIEFREASAAETLAALPPGHAPLDLVFLDADKPHYGDHYETVIPLLRPGGVLVVDNVLWSGEVVDRQRAGWAKSIHEFTELAQADDRTTQVMLAVSDGVTIVRKNG